MAKAALVNGAYQARSVIASAQRCINLYLEANPPTSVFPFTHYPTPGLTLMGSVSPTTWRGLYFATNGQLYGVCGNTVYTISSSWTFTVIGTISSISGPVSMVDNTTDIILVDGVYGNGWTIHLADNSFAQISQAGFYGGNQVNYVDGYFVLNRIGTREWYISLPNTTTFDPIDYASTTGFSDSLVGIGITRRYVYLFGKITTEIWFNQGNTTFPFGRLPGSFMQYGCAATNSIAQMDGELYWVAQSPQGQAFICKTTNFAATIISTFAINNELQSYSTLSDAIGYTYELNGHFFYVVTFPTANKTWVYDLSNQQWNEWNWVDNDGGLNRHRSNCFAFAYGKLIVGDWQNGNLYAIDQDNYTDNGQVITRVRGFYHMEDDGANRVRYRSFISEMESGNGYNNQFVDVSLTCSDDRGKTYGNPVMQSLGKEGEYITSMQWNRLGMARDRVFQLSWSSPVRTALNGAFVDALSNHE
jgi:hypothetical protein